MASDYDPTKIAASGAVLSDGGQTGQRCVISISGIPKKFLSDLTFACTGAAKPDVMTNLDTKSDSIEAFFVPLKPGDYKLTIRCKGRQISGSPFAVKVTGETFQVEKLLSKVVIHGRTHELGKAYTINNFVIDTRNLHPVFGGLRVHMKAPERSSSNLNLRDNQDGTYHVSYKPTAPGLYKLNIRIGEEHIPGSPFTVRVTEFLS